MITYTHLNLFKYSPVAAINIAKQEYSIITVMNIAMP